MSIHLPFLRYIPPYPCSPFTRFSGCGGPVFFLLPVFFLQSSWLSLYSLWTDGFFFSFLSPFRKSSFSPHEMGLFSNSAFIAHPFPFWGVVFPFQFPSVFPLLSAGGLTLLGQIGFNSQTPLARDGTFFVLHLLVESSPAFSIVVAAHNR